MNISAIGKITGAVLGISLMVAAPAAAAANHSGSWHSVASKSSWSNGQDLKNFSLTINVKFSDGKLEYHSVNDNSPAADLNFTAPLDGTVVPMPDSKRFNQISVTKLGPNELQILEMKDGDVIVGSFWTFYDEGGKKMFVRRGVGKAADGKSHEFTEVYELK